MSVENVSRGRTAHMDTTVLFDKARREPAQDGVSKGAVRRPQWFHPALVALAAGLAACGSTGKAPGSTPTAGDEKRPAELRDVRYCEVIPSVTEGSTVTTSVYNTLNYNLCPPVQWAALTVDRVNREFGSQSAKLNGPRHWVMDDMKASGSSMTGKTFTFGGIEMGLRATLTTQAGQPTVGDQRYAPNAARRDRARGHD